MRGRVAAGVAAVAVTALLAGCGAGGAATEAGGGSPSPGDTSSVSATASVMPTEGGVRNVPMQRLTDAMPIARDGAAIEMAFDAAGAVRLLAEPPPIDFATQAILCVALGERPTGGWSLTLQSISLDGTEMRILAREGRPRSGQGTTQAFTYPSDCALVDRTVLPSGELTVRADDTISDEFIVDAAIEVPSR